MASLAQSTCVIYVRMSQDRSGEELGVARHEQECRALARKLGLEVDQVYSDNDQSATSGKHRPAFEAMLEARPHSIVAWHQDRLLRLTKDLERVIDLGIPVYFVTSAENGLDLASPAGRAVARTVSAWSQYEGEQKRLRQVSKNVQLARHGHWQFSNRPYGYERVGGRIAKVPAEAEILREGYRRVTAGTSYRQLAIDWNRRTVPPIFADRWTGERVQRLLENSHYGGVPSYKGEPVDLDEGKAIQWEPILTPREWADFRELKLNRKRKRSWAGTPKHLMSGMLTCGFCGGQMFSHGQDVRQRTNTVNANGNPVRTPRLRSDGSRLKTISYVCFERYCTSISGEFVDAAVRAWVLRTLQDERMLPRLRPDDESVQLIEDIEDLQRRRDDVAELLGDGLIDKVKAREKLSDLSERLERKQAKLSALRAQSPLSDMRLAESFPEKWDKLSVLERRRAIADLGVRLTIDPADQGPRTINPHTGEKYTLAAWTDRRLRWTFEKE